MINKIMNFLELFILPMLQITCVGMALYLWFIIGNKIIDESEKTVKKVESNEPN